jgi:ubiquinone/menaquinone biosynthesis C-methylase UbiE
MMEAKVHRRVQRYGWDIAVADYDRHWVPVLRECSEDCIALAAPAEGERVLDVATGTGVAAFLAASRVGASGEVVATDLAQKMVDATAAEARRRGIGNMRFERADAEELPFADSSFDVVTCVLGLMYPADPQHAIDEMRRVLKPGGRAAVCVWGQRDKCGWNAVFPIVDARVHSDVCPLFYALGAPGALSYAFERAGFADIVERRIDRPLVWATDEEACAAIFAGGPVALAYSKMDAETRAAVHGEFLDSIARYHRDGAYHVAGEFVVLGAQAPA